MIKSRYLLPKLAREAFWSYARRVIGIHNTGRAAFSQEGEDLVIARLLDLDHRLEPGFYVDIGAHHPERYSNTRFFYDRGWRGINVDPLPGMAAKFRAVRPRDTSIEMAVSDAHGELDYIMFDEGALNGCNRELAAARNSQGEFKIVGVRQVPVMSLASVLDSHLPPNTPIDFLSVDVEGHDLNVLRSNDWVRYRPALVLAEDSTAVTLADVATAPVTALLCSAGYVPVSKCALTIIFADVGRLHQSSLGLRIK